MKQAEKARLDNYVDNRDAEVRRIDYSDGGFKRFCNESHAKYLEKVEEFGHSKRYCNAMQSDPKDVLIRREARLLAERQEPREFDVVLGGQPKPTDAVRGGHEKS